MNFVLYLLAQKPNYHAQPMKVMMMVMLHYRQVMLHCLYRQHR